MNATDRLIVKNLLQSMSDSCLFHTEEFRAALKHFNVTTTYVDQQVSDEAAALLSKEHNHFVDVFHPSRIEQHPHGERFWFATKVEADAFSARERMNGDEPVNTKVLIARETHARTLAANIEAAHAEALEMDAEFNFERVSREINQSHTEALEMNQSRSETIRAVIAQALHVAANSFGHVIGEHQELVETLHNAGFADAARKVDALFDEVEGDGTASHKVIRARWREALHRVSASI